MPSFSLLINSIELSRDPRFASLCQAVVAVRAEDRQGTGFSVQPEGLIVSNAHVIGNASQVQISIQSDELHLASSWQLWPAADLALVQADVPNIPRLELELNDKQPNPGDVVTVIGNPLGLFQIVSQAEYVGQMSLPGRSGRVLVIKGPVFRGNSGSPVINADGKVIGILFATAAGSGTISKNTTAYVIPAAEIRAILAAFASQ